MARCTLDGLDLRPSLPGAGKADLRTRRGRHGRCLTTCPYCTVFGCCSGWRSRWRSGAWRTSSFRGSSARRFAKKWGSTRPPWTSARATRSTSPSTFISPTSCAPASARKCPRCVRHAMLARSRSRRIRSAAPPASAPRILSFESARPPRSPCSAPSLPAHTSARESAD